MLNLVCKQVGQSVSSEENVNSSFSFASSVINSLKDLLENQIRSTQIIKNLIMGYDKGELEDQFKAINKSNSQNSSNEVQQLNIPFGEERSMGKFDLYALGLKDGDKIYSIYDPTVYATVNGRSEVQFRSGVMSITKAGAIMENEFRGPKRHTTTGARRWRMAPEGVTLEEQAAEINARN